MNNKPDRSTLNFHQQLSAYKLGLLTDKDLPGIAIAGMEQGYDSTSLRMLAGRQKNENAFVLHDEFVKALAELGLPQKEEKEAFLDLLIYHADGIVNNGIDPYSGYEEIKNLSSKDFDHLDFGLLEVYGIHVSIWEEMMDGLDFHTAKGITKEKYIQTAKEEMRTLLKAWLTKHDNKI